MMLGYLAIGTVSGLFVAAASLFIGASFTSALWLYIVVGSCAVLGMALVDTLRTKG